VPRPQAKQGANSANSADLPVRSSRVSAEYDNDASPKDSNMSSLSTYLAKNYLTASKSSNSELSNRPKKRQRKDKPSSRGGLIIADDDEDFSLSMPAQETTTTHCQSTHTQGPPNSVAPRAIIGRRSERPHPPTQIKRPQTASLPKQATRPMRDDGWSRARMHPQSWLRRMIRGSARSR
jgi:hypothetical protein